MNLRTGVSRKQSKPNFPKNKHFSPPDTHMYVSGSKKCSFSTDELKINEILRTQNCINILYIICSIRGSNSSALFLIKHHFFVFSDLREKTTYKLVMDNYDFGLAKDKR